MIIVYHTLGIVSLRVGNDEGTLGNYGRGGVVDQFFVEVQRAFDVVVSGGGKARFNA